MCLLIHHRADTVFPKSFLADVYEKNSDGFGAMVSVNGSISVVKSLAKLDDIYQIYNEMIVGREAVMHFRMRTHGEIDIDNCHPYEVTPDLYMAHNGVLSTGNAADPKKSDTWHYINNFIKPLLEKDPDLIFRPQFQAMIGAHIGPSNKFGFMNKAGRVAIINRSSGVDHLDAWLSNTYAWTPSKFGYYSKYYTPMTNHSTFNNGYKYQTSFPKATTTPVGRSVTRGTKAGGKKPLVRDLFKDWSGTKLSVKQMRRLTTKMERACTSLDYWDLLNYIQDNPIQVKQFLFNTYDLSSSEINNIVDSSADEAADMLTDLFDSLDQGETNARVRQTPIGF